MWPEIARVSLFGKELPLRSFGLFVALGFLVGLWWGGRLSRRYGQPGDQQRIQDIGWWVLIGILVGGRLGYVLVNLELYAAQPLKSLAIWEGGLIFYGGLILAVLLGAWKARRLGMPMWPFVDYGLTAGFLGQMIGRLGCLAVGDDYGAPTGLPWAITVPDPLPRGSLLPPELAGMSIHPTQIYLSLKALLLFLLGSWLLPRKRFHGQVLAVLLAGYAVLRFLVEEVRWDSAARGGWFRAGMSPDEVAQRLHALGVANAQGEILDVARFQELLRQGVEGVHPELILSTSQMISLGILPLAAWVYWRRRKTPLD